MIGTNTMHKVAPEIAEAITIPLLHIADATAQALQNDGVSRVGLLGTRFTMEQSFYRSRLEQAGIEVLVPNEAQRHDLHRIIYAELWLGQVLPDSRDNYLAIVDSLAHQGSQAVILGCTEIGLLVRPSDTSVPLYDTTEIHADAAVRLALGEI